MKKIQKVKRKNKLSNYFIFEIFIFIEFIMFFDQSSLQKKMEVQAKKRTKLEVKNRIFKLG